MTGGYSQWPFQVQLNPQQNQGRPALANPPLGFVSVGPGAWPPDQIGASSAGQRATVAPAPPGMIFSPVIPQQGRAGPAAPMPMQYLPIQSSLPGLPVPYDPYLGAVGGSGRLVMTPGYQAGYQMVPQGAMVGAAIPPPGFHVAGAGGAPGMLVMGVPGAAPDGRVGAGREAGFGYYFGPRPVNHDGSMVPNSVGADGLKTSDSSDVPSSRGAASSSREKRPAPHGDAEARPSKKTKSKFMCDLPGCQKSFARRSVLKFHVRTVHNGMRDYKCDAEGCGKEFGQKSDLTRHIMTVHERKREFKCPVEGCTWEFGQKGNMVRHLLSVHRRRYEEFSGSDVEEEE